ncbi:hypothetical protein RHGRI_034431 [Rhododendron griersonianum]|uniref:Uncharacterized protein n=1 Tax=Rhododendron griersonianum TaxID=479676 RepID=A0AAV6I117_9ERIC|nr:hypothetical protein RHGRI_034431 [Rhododendron griersonianum]
MPKVFWSMGLSLKLGGLRILLQWPTDVFWSYNLLHFGTVVCTVSVVEPGSSIEGCLCRHILSSRNVVEQIRKNWKNEINLFEF